MLDNILADFKNCLVRIFFFLLLPVVGCGHWLLAEKRARKKRVCVRECVQAQRACARVHSCGQSSILVFVSACLCARALILIERQRVGGNEENIFDNFRCLVFTIDCKIDSTSLFSPVVWIPKPYARL